MSETTKIDEAVRVITEHGRKSASGEPLFLDALHIREPIQAAVQAGAQQALQTVRDEVRKRWCSADPQSCECDGIHTREEMLAVLVKVAEP